jgi:DNA-binding MarR family transcriptional regulator
MSNEWNAVNIPVPDPRARRSPTSDELRAWRSFTETTDLVKRRIETELQQASGLSSGDYAVLLALSEHAEHRIRSSPLAEHIGWERSRLSHHLARMERRGLIVRQAVEHDSRGAQIVLTEQGAHTLRRASSPHLHSVQKLFVTALSTEQLAALESSMSALRDHLDVSPTVQQGESTTLRTSTDDTPTG